MSEDKKEYDLKIQEYAQLLDIRADRIRVSITINHSLTNLVVVVCLFSVRFIDVTIYDHGGSVGTNFLPFLFVFSMPLKRCNSLRFTYICILSPHFFSKIVIFTRFFSY